MLTGASLDRAKVVLAFSVSLPRTTMSRGDGGIFAAVETETLIWGVTALGGAALLVCLLGVVLCCSSQSSSNTVLPRVTTEQKQSSCVGDGSLLSKTGKEGEISNSQGSSDLSSIPVPPWETDPDSEPPGIILSLNLQDDFCASVPRTRRMNEIPYERLVIVSSRTRNANKIPICALPNVAVLTYDWLRWTSKDLLDNISRILCSTQVMSIAVVAPGEKPWQIEVLHHLKTSSENLRVPTVSEFWGELATHVARDGDGHGGRIDFLGCRTSELDGHGAQLLMDLWTLTGIPVACSDDAMAGFPLYTFIHNPTSQDSKLVKSDVSVLDVYFNGKAFLSEVSKSEKNTLRSGSSVLEGSCDWDHLSMDLDSNAFDMEAAMHSAMTLLQQSTYKRAIELEPLEPSHYTGLSVSNALALTQAEAKQSGASCDVENEPGEDASDST